MTHRFTYDTDAQFHNARATCENIYAFADYFGKGEEGDKAEIHFHMEPMEDDITPEIFEAIRTGTIWIPGPICAKFKNEGFIWDEPARKERTDIFASFNPPKK